jgi:hypothetical protein
MSDDSSNKMRWLRPTMNGPDDAVIELLLNALPASESLDESARKQLEAARGYMSELFLRGVSLQRFYTQTGLTGFPVDPKQPGLERQATRACLTYYNLWLANKDAKVASAAIKNVLRFRKERASQYADQMTLQLFVDIDSDNKEIPLPYEAGLTTHAVCMEFNLADVEHNFAAIDAACSTVSNHAINTLRIGLGTFGPQEFPFLAQASVFTKGLPSDMGTEWILFKNIHRRAGKFSWFWKWVARREDRQERKLMEQQAAELAEMQKQFAQSQSEEAAS